MSELASVVNIEAKAYFGPKHPWLPFEKGTRYLSKLEPVVLCFSHRSGWKTSGSGNIAGSRRIKWLDMLTGVCRSSKT